MSREIISYQPGRDVADYAPDTNVGFARSDLVSTDRREIGPADNAQLAADRAACKDCEKALRQVWGAEYEQRVAFIKQILEMEFGQELAEDLLEARMWDGRRIADEPRFSFALSELIGLAVQAVNQGAAQAGNGTSLQDRIAEIKEVMRTNWPRYRAERLDIEYGRLLSQLMPEEEAE
jgi:hypothetical protein